MERLRRRADFVAVARGRRLERRGFVLQMEARRVVTESEMTGGEAASVPRFGFTVTKKVGNAVVRNRIRRRLKAAVSTAAPVHAAGGNDYVLVGRRSALTLDFETLVSDVRDGLDRLKTPRAPSRRRIQGEPPGPPDAG